MDFQTSVRTCLKEKYCTFQGRASRSEYWFFQLFMLLFNIAFEIIFNFLPANILVTIFSFLISVAVILPNVAVAARRLHDTNHTGWWQMLDFFVFWQMLAPVFLFFFAVASRILYNTGWWQMLNPVFLFFSAVASLTVAKIGIIFSIIILIFGIVFFLVLIQKGTEGDNRFGVPPALENIS